ncbi:hypothetical protein [Piscicoccus intestinalis]|uniref:hypothetical protein n=1 Tax=Piscicoccus intestinalis TaxID=746033 RepID=UPI0008398BD7|nr:hypothetical protein [Piscicoccus intestinalis]
MTDTTPSSPDEGTDLNELNPQGAGGTVGSQDTFEPEESEGDQGSDAQQATEGAQVDDGKEATQGTQPS